MANQIFFRRGLEVNLPSLAAGEPGFTTDTNKLYIGSELGNIEIGGEGGPQGPQGEQGPPGEGGGGLEVLETDPVSPTDGQSWILGVPEQAGTYINWDAPGQQVAIAFSGTVTAAVVQSLFGGSLVIPGEFTLNEGPEPIFEVTSLDSITFPIGSIVQDLINAINAFTQTAVGQNLATLAMGSNLNDPLQPSGAAQIQSDYSGPSAQLKVKVGTSIFFTPLSLAP